MYNGRLFCGRVLWFIATSLSAITAMLAIISFEKNPMAALIFGVVSCISVKQTNSISKHISLTKESGPMEKKIIAMVNEDSDVDALCRRIDQRKQFALKKMKNLEKKIYETQESLSKDCAEDWVTLTDWLRSKGRLPKDYNDKSYSLGFNLKDNGIAVSKQIQGVFSKHNMPEDLKISVEKFIKSELDGDDDDSPKGA